MSATAAFALCVPFGNPAVPVGPVALRPLLAKGLPLSRPAIRETTSKRWNIVQSPGLVKPLDLPLNF